MFYSKTQSAGHLSSCLISLQQHEAEENHINEPRNTNLKPKTVSKKTAYVAHLLDVLLLFTYIH